MQRAQDDIENNNWDAQSQFTDKISNVSTIDHTQYSQQYEAAVKNVVPQRSEYDVS